MAKILKPFVTKELIEALGGCKEGIDWFEMTFPNGATTDENLAELDKLQDKRFYNWAFSVTCKPNAKLLQQGEFRVTKIHVFNPLTGLQEEYTNEADATARKAEIVLIIKEQSTSTIASTVIISREIVADETDEVGNVIATYSEWETTPL